jgi:DNA-binding SARP family transcriptional activator/tetratricopeptide (TPR) repeat protein
MSKASAGEIRLLCIGDTRILTPLGEIDPSAEVVFAAALYLILERKERTARRRLQQLLWPGSRPDRAAHRLRQTIFKLRRAGLPVEADGKSCIFLDARTVTTDFDAFERTSGVQPAVETLAVPLFAAFEAKFSADFAEWLDGQKAAIGSSLTRVLLGMIGRFRIGGDWQAVEKHSRALLLHAPDNEEATLALAESLAMRGDKIQGVRVLENYLTDIGRGPSDLRLSASTMRKRIIDRMPPRATDLAAEVPLLGREEYLKQLVQILDVANAGAPQTCVILGNPGIGKSRLVTEFLAFAALQGAIGHRVFCRSSDSARPLAILLELIPLLRGMRGSIGSDPDTLAFLDALTTHRPERSKRSHAAVVSDPVHSRLDIALADIIDAVSDERTVVLVIEDCQWIDAASAAILERLVSKLSNQRLLLLLTSRIIDTGRMIESIVAGKVLTLPALNDAASADIVHTIARQRGKSVSDHYLAWCTRVAEGNPFFLHELASHWVETGDEHSAPPSLTAVLKQRLSRLSSNALQLLQTCSLLENHSTVDNIEAVLGLAPHELLRCINELAGAGMVSVVTGDGMSVETDRLNSRHDLLSDTALMQLAAPARAYLHRRAATVLESRIDHTGDAATLWSCAKHWQLAGDNMQAFRLTNSCARHLIEAELPGEAAEAFSKAIEYCTTETDLLSVLESQAAAHFQSSDWIQVIDLATQARTIKRRLFPDMGQHDDLELMLRRAEWRTMNWDHILSHSLNCLSADQASAAHRIEAGVMALKLLGLRGDRGAGTSVFAQISKLQPEASESNADLILQAKMIFNTEWGAFDKAVAAAMELVEVHRKKRDIGALFRALCNAAITLRAAGQFESAVDHLREALALADRHKIHLSKTEALRMLAHMAIEQGWITEARTWLDALRKCPVAVGDRMIVTEIGSIEARLALLDGRYPHARDLVNNDLLHMRSDQLPQRRAYWHALRVASDLASDGRSSGDALNALESEHLRTRNNLFQAFASFALYAGLVRAGEQKRAELLLNEYLTRHRREPWPPPKHLLNSLLELVGSSSELPRSN